MFLLNLPDELLLLVISYLDGCSLYCLSRAERKLKALIGKRTIATPTAAFFEAMRCNYAEIVKFIVHNDWVSTLNLEIAASEASERGNLEAVKALLDLGPYTDYSEALWAAAENGKEDIVDVILRWDRDNVIPERWRRLRLPFEIAKKKAVRNLLIQHSPKAALPHMVLGNHIEEVKGILEAGTLSQEPEILDIATSYGTMDMVRLLLAYGYHSQHAYMIAIRKSNLELADLLNGDPNAMLRGERPLHVAARTSSAVSITYLLASGADQTLLDEHHQSAFDIAIGKGDELAIRAFNHNRHRYPVRNRKRYAPESRNEKGKRRTIGQLH